MSRAFRTFDGDVLRQWELTAGGLEVTKETHPAEGDVYKVNAEARKGGVFQDLSFGRCVASIPPGRYRQLLRKYPELASTDAEIATKAWRRFLLSSESLPYRTVEKL